MPSRLRQGQLLAVFSDVWGRWRREGEAEEGRGEEVEDGVEAGWGDSKSDRGEGRGGRRGGEKGESREGQFHWPRRRGKRGEGSGIEEGEEGVGRGDRDHAGAAVQGEGVVDVTLPARIADTVVHFEVLPVEVLQSQDMGRRKRVAPCPLMTPQPAAVHRASALCTGHITEATAGHSSTLQAAVGGNGGRLRLQRATALCCALSRVVMRVVSPGVS